MTTQNPLHGWPFVQTPALVPVKIPKWIRQQFGMESNQVINQEDEQFIYRVMVQVLKYPDKKLSDLHRDANRLGKFDLRSEKEKEKKVKGKTQQGNLKQKQRMNESKQNILTEGDLIEEEPLNKAKKSLQYCECCGLVRQQESIPLCTSFEQFPIIGLSTFLYFRTIINVIVLLFILLIIYCGFCVVVNYAMFVKGEGETLSDGLYLIADNYDTIFSYKSVQTNYITFEDELTVFTRIEAILIMVVAIVWSLCVYLFKHLEVQYQELIDDESITASDFGVMIQKAPINLFKDFNFISQQFDQYYKNTFPIIRKQYFQKHLKTDKYEKNPLSAEEEFKKLKLKKINIGIPFYLNQSNLEDDQQYAELKKQFDEHQQVLVGWIAQFFQKKKLFVTKQKREREVVVFQEIQKKIQQKEEHFKKSLQEQYNKSTTEQMTTTVFLVFECAVAAKIVYELNPNTFTSKIRYALTCCNKQKMIELKDKNGQKLDIIISRAPQPQDIIWQNVGYSFCQVFKRRCLTYLITIAILVGSFFLITFLSDIQLKTQSSMISFAISLSLTILNIIIGIIIYELTVFEKDFTKTNYQASLSLKTVFAQIVNSIAVPLLVKQDNIYGTAGLVEDVFYLAITTALIDPILKFLDFYYFYTRLKYWLNSKPYKKLGVDQSELNEEAALMEFEAGAQYIFTVNLFLICCFFTPLQPIIPLFSIVGLILMYWASKNTLLNRMTRPMPGSDMINEALGSVITLGPIMLAAGAMLFSDILSQHGDRNLKFLLHLIAIGLGTFLYLLPFKAIYRIVCFEDEQFYNLSYFQNRILLPSEYDRINPATSDAGMQDFMNYLQQLNDILVDKDPNDQNQTSSNRNRQRLLGNLAIMAKRVNQNPESKQTQNLKSAASNMKSNKMMKDLFSGGGPNPKNNVFGMKLKRNINNPPGQPIKNQNKNVKSDDKNIVTNPQKGNQKVNKEPLVFNVEGFEPVVEKSQNKPVIQNNQLIKSQQTKSEQKKQTKRSQPPKKIEPKEQTTKIQPMQQPSPNIQGFGSSNFTQGQAKNSHLQIANLTKKQQISLHVKQEKQQQTKPNDKEKQKPQQQQIFTVKQQKPDIVMGFGFQTSNMPRKNKKSFHDVQMTKTMSRDSRYTTKFDFNRNLKAQTFSKQPKEIYDHALYRKYIEETQNFNQPQINSKIQQIDLDRQLYCNSPQRKRSKKLYISPQKSRNTLSPSKYSNTQELSNYRGYEQNHRKLSQMESQNDNYNYSPEYKSSQKLYYNHIDENNSYQTLEDNEVMLNEYPIGYQDFKKNQSSDFHQQKRWKNNQSQERKHRNEKLQQEEEY